MSMPNHVRIVEVGARDGLQNEKTLLPAEVKIALIDRLSATGLKTIEATSFEPKWVPQLADAAEAFARIRKLPGVSYPVLVPNLQGYQRAREVDAREVAVFTAASEAFNRKNINASIHELIERFIPVLEQALGRRGAGARLRLHRARLPLPGRGAGGRRGARGAPHARVGLPRDLAGRHHRRGHAGEGARDAARGGAGSTDGRAGRAFPRHLRPGTGEHPGLPGGRRARGRQRRVRHRRLPVREGRHRQRRQRGRGLHAARMAWIPASTSTCSSPPARGWPRNCTRKPPTARARRLDCPQRDRPGPIESRGNDDADVDHRRRQRHRRGDCRDGRAARPPRHRRRS
ncbi:hypothetical protein RLIN73S_06575 [Rhodanobacter lindaniclasticus]